MNNCDLRTQVKELKCFQNVTYKKIAELLGITYGSFVNYLHGQYELGEEKNNKLQEIINELKEN